MSFSLLYPNASIRTIRSLTRYAGWGLAFLFMAGLAVALENCTPKTACVPGDTKCCPQGVCASTANAPVQLASMPGSDASSNSFHEAEVISQVAPRYPEEARSAGITGSVMLQIKVNTSGEIDSIQIEKCNPIGVGFEKAAVDAAKQWKFKPATKDGTPVASWLMLPLRFKLGK